MRAEYKATGEYNGNELMSRTLPLYLPLIILMQNRFTAAVR